MKKYKKTFFYRREINRQKLQIIACNTIQFLYRETFITVFFVYYSFYIVGTVIVGYVDNNNNKVIPWLHELICNIALDAFSLYDTIPWNGIT